MTTITRNFKRVSFQNDFQLMCANILNITFSTLMRTNKTYKNPKKPTAILIPIGYLKVKLTGTIKNSVKNSIHLYVMERIILLVKVRNYFHLHSILQNRIITHINAAIIWIAKILNPPYHKRNPL